VVAAAVALLIVALLHVVVHSNTLPDTWISLAGGRHIAAHGVGDTDPFAFDSRPAASAALPADAPGSQRLWAWLHPTGWINQNWLSHLVLHLVTRAGGENTLLAWKAIVYGLVAALLFLASRLYGAGTTISLVVSAAALVVARPFLEIRAQDHTNLVVAGLMVLLRLAATRDRRWWWGVPPLFAVWCNLHGGFVFGFIALLVYLATGWLARDRLGLGRTLATPALRTGVLATACAVAASVVASPYRLANLSHLVEISIGANAAEWRIVQEWAPLWRVAPGDLGPFAALAVAWATALAMVARAPYGRGRRAGTGSAALPGDPKGSDRLDVPATAVAATAVILALFSHRFLPIASIVLAPQLAGWVEQLVAHRAARRAAAATTARVSLRSGRVAPALAWTLTGVAGTAFTVTLVRLLFAPWPADEVQTSPLARLAYRHLRPAGACAFLAANHVSGRIWNFWEEGGYLAYCQEPDAATGANPVLVTIDARAQGAYPVTAFRRYLQIRDGGPAGQAALAAGRPLTAAEWREARDWTRGQLAGLGITLADVHEAQRHLTVSLVLGDLPEWQPVYADNEHTLLADTTSAAGTALAQAAAASTIVFPDEFSRCLTGALRLQASSSEADLERLVALARQAYRLRPAPRAVEMTVAALRAASTRGEAIAFLDEVVEDFFAQRERYRRQHGYARRVAAAYTALDLLQQVAPTGARQGDGARLAEVAAERVRLEHDLLF
jgi:hypothetical protein